MSKKLSMAIALIMVFAMVLTACGGDAVSSSSSASASSSTPASSAASSTADSSATDPGAPTFTDGISGPNEFPFVETKTELVIATPYHPYTMDFDTNEQTIKMEEMSGLDIVWDILPEQNFGEKINLMFASNTGMPDVFTACQTVFTREMLATLGAQKLVTPVNDLLEKWGVNFKELSADKPEIIPLLTSPDGNIYTMPAYGRNEPNTYAQRFWINKKFMDALGITKLPETTDEYYDFLKAVKENDPNGNGKADEVPLAAAPVNNGWFEHIDGFLLQPFIYMDSTNNTSSATNKRRIYMTPEGKIEYAPVQEGYREGLRYLNKLFAEGLMSSDVFTMSKEDLRSLVEFEGAELVGSLPCGGPHEFANTTGERRKDYVILPPLAGPDGTRQAYWNEYEGLTYGFWVIPATSTNADLAAKLADYIYTKEMTLWARYGVEDRDWQVPAPGTKAFDGGQAQIEIINPDLVWGQTQNVYLATRLPTWGRFGSHAGVDAGDPYHLEKVLWDAMVAYQPYKTDQYVPPLSYTDEEAREWTELSNTLHQYVELSLAEFVTGARDLDKDWDAYVAECDRIGLPRIMEINHTAFERQWASTWKATHFN